jgi:Protein of unknown function (DUF1353)
MTGRLFRTTSVILAVAGCLLGSTLVLANAGGKFEGRLITEWLDDGRNMKLLGAFRYLSPDRLKWEVPEGTVVNGASIPQFLWSFIGSPFGDKYRKASVIHDYYCESRTRESGRVHKVFYEAMLDAGVNEAKAWILYEAVRRFGPRWTMPEPTCQRVNGRIDFSKCTRNSLTSKPEVTQPKAGEADIQEFLRKMKSSKYPDAARQLEESLNP